MHSGIQVWRSVPSTPPDYTRALCARILDALDEDARQHGAHCLVALSMRALEGHFAHAALEREEPGCVLPRRGPGGTFPRTTGDIFVQIAAPDADTRLYLLRKAQRTLETFCWLDVELLGARIGDGREPFGFRDGLRPPTRKEVLGHATIPDGPARGASWILYQRWRQDRERFHLLREQRQADIIGRWPDGEENPHALENAHVSVVGRAAQRAPFVRRGFPFRAGGHEGLCFIAASRSPRHFETALEHMLGHGGAAPDAMLPYAFAVEGGIYLAPPNADWLYMSERRAIA